MTRPITGQPLVDAELLAWAAKVLADLFTASTPAPAAGGSR
jgi:hypothetical protein